MTAQSGTAAEGAEKPWVFEPVKIPAWVRKVTRMAFVTPGEVEKAAELGVLRDLKRCKQLRHLRFNE